MSGSIVRGALAALAFGACFAGAASAQEDVLAPARAGQVQCYEPNAAAKTCESLAAYVTGADGAISNTAEVLIFPNPTIVMRITSPVTVRNGAICGPLRAEDITTAQFTVNGAAASAEDAQAIRAQINEQMMPVMGAEVCSTYAPQEGGGFVVSATFNGAPQQNTQRMIWVRPEDGYRVAP